MLDANQVLSHSMWCYTITSKYLIECAKHKRRKNIEIESRKLPKISGFIAIKVSPTADYANKGISGRTAGRMNSPLDHDLDGIYASHVLQQQGLMFF